MAAAAASSASAADPSSTSPSPRAARAVRHPWSYVVRGEPEASNAAAAAVALPSPSSPPAQPPAAATPFLEPSDGSPRKLPPEDVAPSSSEATRGKKPAWKRPPNGSIEAGLAVMGSAASWPALSESAKSTSKSMSPSDGPLAAPPVPVISSSLPKSNSNPSSTPNHVAPERQKSMKRGGGSSNDAPGVGGAALPLPPPTSAPMRQANPDKQAPPELSPRNQTAKNTTNGEHGSRGGGLGSQAHDGGDHHRSYGGNRRWNNGGGSGSHHNYGNRRDQERGGYDGYRRNAGGRDVHMQPRIARPYLRLPPPVATPFLGPLPQVRPYGNSMVFPGDMPSPILFVATQPPPGGVSFVPHPAMPPAMFMPAIDPQRASLLKQIDYYFSAENLCRDIYLRQNMDELGWVPISLIAGFNRVRQLTNSTDFILDTVRFSSVVEVQGAKIRKRNDWMNWILPPSNNQFAKVSSQPPSTLNSDNLAAHLRTVDLEEAVDDSSTGVPNRSDS